jgi:hypothetical protein
MLQAAKRNQSNKLRMYSNIAQAMYAAATGYSY